MPRIVTSSWEPFWAFIHFNRKIWTWHTFPSLLFWTYISTCWRSLRQSSYRVQPGRQAGTDERTQTLRFCLRTAFHLQTNAILRSCGTGQTTKTLFIPGLCRFMTEKREWRTTFGLEIRRKKHHRQSKKRTLHRMTHDAGITQAHIFIQTLYCHISVKKKNPLRSQLQDGMTS